MVKSIRRSLARRLGRNMGDRRRAVGLTQEQLAEYLDIDTLAVFCVA
jgi:DNA-binding XRE family transcriptional regulator